MDVANVDNADDGICVLLVAVAAAAAAVVVDGFLMAFLRCNLLEFGNVFGGVNENDQSALLLLVMLLVLTDDDDDDDDADEDCTDAVTDVAVAADVDDGVVFVMDFNGLAGSK